MKNNKKIILVGGCFDILHIGHLRLLEKAKKLGDVLMVGINDDLFIKKTKGKNRPIIPAKQRREILLGLKCVDKVFVTNMALYDDRNLIKYSPDVLVFGTEKAKLKRRKKIAKEVEDKFPKIKTVFLNSGVNYVSTTKIENKIIKK